MIRIPTSIAAVSICIVCLACLTDNRAAKEEFDREIKEGVTAELIEDWPKSEVHYLAALQAAEKMKWIAGIAATKQKLGDVYSRDKKIAEAEKAYVEAKDICLKDWTCKGMETHYEKLILFYIYYGRDPAKALKTMDEMSDQKARLNEGTIVKEKYKSYAGDLQIAGFEKEAGLLKEVIRQMP